MNKKERLILHGLYCDRKLPNEEKCYTANEIKWLARNWFYYKGRKWRGKDELKAVEDKDEDYLASKNATSAASTRELTYLKDDGYISFTKEGSLLRIGVTVKGTDLARELDFPLFGPLNVWYKNHKDGLMGVILTILVAMVTTILTNKYLL